MKRASQPPQPTHRGTADESRESTALISATSSIPTHEPKVVKKPVHSVSTTHESIELVHRESTHQSYSRLPKLSLPTFSGNPLQWQSF